jgi:hypothetical protein
MARTAAKRARSTTEQLDEAQADKAAIEARKANSPRRGSNLCSPATRARSTNCVGKQCRCHATRMAHFPRMAGCPVLVLRDTSHCRRNSIVN